MEPTYSYGYATSRLSVAGLRIGVGSGNIARLASWTGTRVGTHGVRDGHGHGSVAPRVGWQRVESRTPTEALEIVHDLKIYQNQEDQQLWGRDNERNLPWQVPPGGLRLHSDCS